MKNKVGMEKFVMMAGWDGDALAGSREEALERQQEMAETQSGRGRILLPHKSVSAKLKMSQ